MKQLFIFLAINICVFQVTIAQKEFNNWYFGSKSALNFGAGAPAFVPGSNLISQEGSSSISDKQGNLLFYTNGVTVWNRNHAVMPNGNGLNGDVGSTQTVLITNHPGNDFIYYIFTVPKEGDAKGFQYSVVNMQLNGGLGDVDPIIKNVAFNLPVCEKIAAVKHRNRNDIWIILKVYNSDQFIEYLIDCSGFITYPQGSYYLGSKISTPLNAGGYLRASPDGKKLAMANFGGNIELFDFNDDNGAITNAQIIPANPGFACGPYGVEFSPDSKLLYSSQAYTCNGGNTYDISQYRLDAGNIAASQVILETGSSNVAGALQLGPDKKIYIAYDQAGYLGSIANPNVPGPGCGLVKQSVSLPAPALSGLGLPNIATGYDRTLLGEDTIVCEGTSKTITLDIANTNYLWSDGSTGNSLTITATGEYWVRITHGACVYRDTINVTFQEAPKFSLGNDSSICENKFPYVLKRFIPGATYLWQDGSTDSTFAVSKAGVYWMKATVNGCTGIDSAEITALPVDSFTLGADSIVCEGQPLVLTAPAASAKYLWSTGSAASSINVGATGLYWCEATNSSGCVYRDSIRVTFRPVPVVKLGNDTLLCQNKFPYLLQASVPGATYVWQDGSTGSSFSVQSGGVYWVQATLNGCSAVDSITFVSNPVESFNLGADSIMCGSQPVTLTVTPDFTTYLWSTGSTSKTITVNSTGEYWCEATNSSGCSYRDTIKLTFNPVSIVNLGKDTILCENSLPLVIGQNISNATYLWQDGTTNAFYSVTSNGIYWVDATINGCSTRDSIAVSVESLPVFSLGADSIICGTKPVALNVTPASAKYLWNTGSTSNSIIVSSSGVYWAEATSSAGCRYRDSINISFKPSPVFNLGQDTSLCENKFPYVLRASVPGATYLWQDGSTGSTFSVPGQGVYWMEATAGGCSVRDSVSFISIPVDVFNLGPDSIICGNQPLTLTVIPAFTKYLWSNGSTSKSISVNSTGVYWCEATNSSGCSFRDTISLAFNPSSIVDLGNDTLLCRNSLPFVIGKNISNASYLWQDGSTNALFTVTDKGLYWVEATINGCSTRDSIYISVGDITTFDLGAAITSCANEPVTLGVSQPFDKYLWSNGSTTQNITVINPGDYWLKATNASGCSSSDTIRVDFRPAPVVNLGNDISLCQNKLPLQIGQTIAGASYLWQDGSKNAFYTVTAPGIYWLQAEVNGCAARDSIAVNSSDATPFSLGADTVVCNAQTLQLGMSAAFSQYLWNTGSTNKFLTVNATGNYWLEAVNSSGCSYRDSIYVKFNASPVFSLGRDTIVCNTAGYLLDVSNAGDSFLWQDKSTQPRFAVNKTGTYHVLVSREGCSSSDTVSVTFKSKPAPDLGIDKNICPGDELILNPAIAAIAFTWQDGSKGATYKVTTPGKYTVVAANECGAGADEVIVSLGACKMLVPNAFTPGKSTNNIFRLPNANGLKDFSLQVFNRWGQQLYQTSVSSQGWNGTYKGIDQPAGMYVYIISYTDGTGEVITQKGTVVLVR